MYILHFYELLFQNTITLPPGAMLVKNADGQLVMQMMGNQNPTSQMSSQKVFRVLNVFILFWC
jgi:hypothetical protein